MSLHSFFKAGGASGTIAKTMSAYDMKFSDAIYGKSKRYVSQERLITMLRREYGLLEERLEHMKGNTSFFVFANTVETLNYKKTNQGHGWLGVRFQSRPGLPANECVIHVLMHDPNAIWQHQAISYIGVNLIYACLYHTNNPERMIDMLTEKPRPRTCRSGYVPHCGH